MYISVHQNFLLLPVLFIPLFFSCKSSKTEADRLRVQLTGQGISVFDNNTGKQIINGISASYSSSEENNILIDFSNSRMTAQSFNDDMGSGTETTWENQPSHEAVMIRWQIRTFTGKPAIACRLELLNTGNDSHRISVLNPVYCPEKVSGVIFNSNAELHYLDIVPETWAPKRIMVLDTIAESRFVTGIADSLGDGVVMGSTSVNRFRTFFRMADNRNESGTINIRAFNNVDDYLELEPQDTLSSEWIYLDCVSNIYDGLEQWAQTTGKYNHAVTANPPATGFYTWYYYRDSVSEKVMLDNAKFLAENRDRFPVNFVHIDWGWQRDYSSGDTTANEKFPHGLKWLAGRISDYGFHPSIWVNPFMYDNPSAEPVKKEPDIFLKDTAGNLVRHEPIRNIMAGFWGDAEYMILKGNTNVLDVSNPAAYDFLEKRYHWVRSMGYDMAMMDFIIYGRINYDGGNRLKYPDVSNFEGIRNSLTAAKQGMGTGGNILGCGTIYETCIGISNLTRVSTDATANWKSVKVASNDLILQYYMNGNLWTNYADGIFVRDKVSPYWGEFETDEDGNRFPMFVTDDEAQFYTAVTGLTQAAVMYTEDIQRLKPERQWLLSMILPIFQAGKFRPVDLFKNIPPKTLELACDEGNRHWIVAAGLNWSDYEEISGLDLSLLDLPENRYHAFDIFNQEYLGDISSDTVLGPVRRHGVLLVNLTPFTGHPQFIGDDLHISQGGFEIKKETWNDEQHELSFSLGSMEGRKGSIFIWYPGILKPTKLPAGLSAKSAPIGMIAEIPVYLDKDKILTLKFIDVQ